MWCFGLIFTVFSVFHINIFLQTNFPKRSKTSVFFGYQWFPVRIEVVYSTKNDTRTTANVHGPESNKHSAHGTACHAKETLGKTWLRNSR